MRKLGLIILLTGILLPGFSQEQLTRKEKRDAKRDTAFAVLVELVKSGEFVFDAQRASPQSGKMIDLTTHHAEFTIAKDTAAGFLPFFGRAFTPEYGGSGGIEFDGAMQEYSYKQIDEKRKIRLEFEVQGETDRYSISMDLSTMESVSVTVISNKRAPISYSGRIKAISEKE